MSEIGTDDDWNVSGPVTAYFNVEKRGKFRSTFIEITDPAALADIERRWKDRYFAAFNSPTTPFLG